MKKTLLILFFLVLPLSAWASSAMVEVDTGLNNVNALEGVLHFPAYLNIQEIYTGGSMILLWLNEPKIATTTHSITFAGLTPGGFRGKREIFKITGDFNQADLSAIYFTGVRSLANDGKGTAVSVRLRILMTETKSDLIPPEPFKLTLAKSEDLFAGLPFISFATQDKETGISKFEVAEKFIGSPGALDWRETQTPYLVEDNLLIKEVYVRAIDKAGNERLESLALPHRVPLMIFLAIIIGVPCILALRFYVRSS